MKFYLKKFIIFGILSLVANSQLKAMEWFSQFGWGAGAPPQARPTTPSPEAYQQQEAVARQAQPELPSIVECLADFKRRNLSYDEFTILGYPLLHYAVNIHGAKGLQDVIDYLNSNNIPLTQEYDSPYNVKRGGETVLYYAVRLHSLGRLKDIEIIKMLLKQRDLNVNELNSFGQTAFDFAEQNSLNDIIDIFKGDKGCKRASELSSSSGSYSQAATDNVAPTYYANGSSSSATASSSVAKESIPDCVRGELEKMEKNKIPFDKYRSEATGNTLLHTAISCDSPEAFKLVLEYLNGFKGKKAAELIVAKVFSRTFFARKAHESDEETGKILELRNGYGDTPLHLAVRLNQIDCVKLLLINGANINALNSVLKTPLDEAYEVQNKYGDEMINLLTKTKIGKRLGAKRGGQTQFVQNVPAVELADEDAVDDFLSSLSSGLSSSSGIPVDLTQSVIFKPDENGNLVNILEGVNRAREERETREREERERLEAQQREQERQRVEQETRDREERERMEAQRAEQEAREQLERETREREERAAREREERVRLETERRERQRQAQEKAQQEQQRLEAEQLQRERLENERLDRERLEREERAAQLREERKRQETERLARVEAQRIEQERQRVEQEQETARRLLEEEARRAEEEQARELEERRRREAEAVTVREYLAAQEREQARIALEQEQKEAQERLLAAQQLGAENNANVEPALQASGSRFNGRLGTVLKYGLVAGGALGIGYGAYKLIKKYYLDKQGANPGANNSAIFA